MNRWGVALALAVLLTPEHAGAHAMLPGLLRVASDGPGTWQVDFRPPAAGGAEVVLPEACAPRVRVSEQGWVLRCPASELVLSVRAPAGTELLAVFSERVERLRPGERWTPAAAAPSPAAPAVRAYLGLGVEHILIGFDHLAFVFGLLLLVRGGRRVALVLTAFTAAHSLTLAAAALGWVHAPGAPVEATIALSVVFVARQAALGQLEGLGRAFAFALVFGLLHGLGFAGALGQLGLPEGRTLEALALFNLGVELGQLAVVALALSLVALVRRGLGPRIETLRTGFAYGLGVLAALWTIERVAAGGGFG